jgi:LytR cell envelope-related transcriptional attenuator
MAGISLTKALIVLAVFVVATILLVNAGTKTPSLSADTTPTTVAPTASTSTTTTAPASTTTTVAPSTVSVLTANGTSQVGLATTYQTKLQPQGWNMLTPVDTTTPVATSNVYYAAGQSAPAAAIAASLGIKPSAVKPLTTSVPVTGASGADVVVVIGSDLATGATTTTT